MQKKLAPVVFEYFRYRVKGSTYKPLWELPCTLFDLFDRIDAELIPKGL